MADARIVLVGGGVRSGKSRWALRRATALGARRTFVATAQALDAEMRTRITRHRAERGEAFTTREAPTELSECLASLADTDVVLVDCLTLWLANLMLAGHDEPALLARVDALVASLLRRRFHCVLVTNEVGMGIVPDSPLGRAFRDIAGLTHQRVAAVADELYLATMGTVLRLKPAPVELMENGTHAQR